MTFKHYILESLKPGRTRIYRAGGPDSLAYLKANTFQSQTFYYGQGSYWSETKESAHAWSSRAGNPIMTAVIDNTMKLKLYRTQLPLVMAYHTPSASEDGVEIWPRSWNAAVERNKKAGYDGHIIYSYADNARMYVIYNSSKLRGLQMLKMDDPHARPKRAKPMPINMNQTTLKKLR